MDEFPGNPPNPPLSKGGRGRISEISCRFGRKIISKRLTGHGWVFTAVMTFYKTSHFPSKEILTRVQEKFKEEKSRKGTRTLCN
jgi:hypothetical protein